MWSSKFYTSALLAAERELRQAGQMKNHILIKITAIIPVVRLSELAPSFESVSNFERFPEQNSCLTKCSYRLNLLHYVILEALQFISLRFYATYQPMFTQAVCK